MVSISSSAKPSSLICSSIRPRLMDVSPARFTSSSSSSAETFTTSCGAERRVCSGEAETPPDPWAVTDLAGEGRVKSSPLVTTGMLSRGVNGKIDAPSLPISGPLYSGAAVQLPSPSNSSVFAIVVLLAGSVAKDITRASGKLPRPSMASRTASMPFCN